MNHKKQAIWVITALLLSLTLAAQADYRVLHNFAGGVNDGATPYGSFICSGSNLYGMTFEGGSNNLGTVFRINIDSNDFNMLHDFNIANGDGQNPWGSLLLSGSTLYGLATSYYTSNNGTLFAIDINGTGFHVLHNFSSNLKWPHSTLTQSSQFLYGTTSGSSGSDRGSVFKFNPNDSNFQTLLVFTGSNGAYPYSQVIPSGTILLGTTQNGGSAGLGTIFKVGTDGTNFPLLHSFVGGSNDGAYMGASVLLSGSTLYGMTYGGGTSDLGTIFKFNIDNNTFKLLHSFTGGSTDGQNPWGSLILSGSILYGMTPSGGANNHGTIFKFDTDSNNFELLHSFTGADGASPGGDLCLSGLTLYGMTGSGGSNGLGVIFALDVPVICVQPPPSDLNGDCKVDFQDFAIMAGKWLECGLYPPEACNK